jgi:hypothetical protein
MVVLGAVFDKFVSESPVSVMTRALLENVLQPGPLDEMFDRTAEVQYTDELLFSTVVDVMGLVACGFYDSPHAVYLAKPELFPVTLKCFYEKLQGIELPVMRALVSDTASRLQSVLTALGPGRPALLPGYRVKILDGNCLAGTDHRIKELRDLASAALPGKTLAVLDPQLGLIIDVFPCEDGHAQERSLLADVLATVEAGDLWIEDRNFCTRGWLHGVVDRQGHVLVREHAGLPWTPASELRFIGRVETGEVWEQEVDVEPDGAGEAVRLRRIVIQLDKPTRDGESTIALLTDVAAADADALTLARLYLERWQIETAFQVLTVVLNCEQSRLGYPRAALFAFCIAVVAYNVLAVIKGALGVVHGCAKVDDEVSMHHVTKEVSRTYAGMMIAIPPREWLVFRAMSAEQMAETLLALARGVPLAKYKKAPTREKKVKVRPRYNPEEPHVSTAKLLAKRQQK